MWSRAYKARVRTYWETPEVRQYFKMLARWAGRSGRGESKVRGDADYYSRIGAKGRALLIANRERRRAEKAAREAIEAANPAADK